ncbi:MAG: hypothetical protein HY615_14315 [Candidatus Rokubacteria bacterium]|nr:hypothetical protein [Candidatus Rokubacteria bacterium]
MPDPRASAIDPALAIWGRRRFLASVVFAGSLAGAVTVAASLPGIYRAAATVLVERLGVSETFVRPSVTGELDTRLQTIGQEVLSRARLRALVERFGLDPDPGRQDSRDAAIAKVRRDIQVELKGAGTTTGRGTTIAFTVAFRGRDPETVARVANALAAFYVEENLKIRERQATDTARFLAAQLEETRSRLDEEDRRIMAFKRRHLGELPEQVAVNLATLERLNAQLALNVSSQMRVLEQRAALARQLTSGEPVDAAEDAEMPAARLARLRRELATMQRLYSDKYPDVVRLKAEIAAVEQQVAKAGPLAPAEPAVPGTQTSLGRLDAELDALKIEQRRLRQAIAAYQGRVEATPEREQELQEMSRDYRTAKETYDAMLKRYQDALVAEDLERRRTGGEFRVLDPAVPPRQPVTPNRFRLVLVGGLLALGAAAGAIVLAERLDTSFHTLDDLRLFTRVPVLASIPRIVRAGDAARRARQRWLATASIAVGLTLVVLFSYHVAHDNEPLVRLLSRGASSS